MTKDYVDMGVGVAVDTAFLLKTTEYDGGQLFEKIMQQMQRTPMIHEFIYKQELIGSEVARNLVEKEIVHIITYKDFLTDVSLKDQYERIFRQAYKGMNGFPLPKDVDVFSYQRANENLGEIHTALMAQHMNIDLMVSDDVGAKKYIECHMNSSRHKLSVQNIPDVLISLSETDRSRVKWQDLKGLAKSLYGIGKRYQEIRDYWV